MKFKHLEGLLGNYLLFWIYFREMRLPIPDPAGEVTDDAIIYSVMEKSLAYRLNYGEKCEDSYRARASFGNSSHRSRSIMDSIASDHDTDVDR